MGLDFPSHHHCCPTPWTLNRRDCFLLRPFFFKLCVFVGDSLFLFFFKRTKLVKFSNGSSNSVCWLVQFKILGDTLFCSTDSYSAQHFVSSISSSDIATSKTISYRQQWKHLIWVLTCTNVLTITQVQSNQHGIIIWFSAMIKWTWQEKLDSYLNNGSW